MKYTKIGDEEYLEGTYTASEEKSGRACPGGYVKLKKIKKSIFGTDPKVQKRLNEIAKIRKPNPAPTKPTISKPAQPATTRPTMQVAKKAPNPSVPPKPKYVAKPPTDIAIVKPPVKTGGTTTAVPAQRDTVTKTNTPQVVVAPPKPKPIPIPPAPPILATRSTELASSIKVKDSAEFVLNFYDFGEVDGDVVTIYVNNVAVVTKATLGTKPIEVPIKVSATVPVVEVIMFADNLGTIPPNTAYMTVKVNGKRHELTIESSEQKNASIKFELEK